MSNRAEQRRQRRQQGRSGGGGGSSSSLFSRVLIAVAVVAGALVVWNVVFTTAGDGARVPIPVEFASTAELVEVAQGVSRGDPDAPITLMDFSDYQCPSCATFTFQAKPFLETDYIEEGLLQFVYYDFPIVTGHRNAFFAARAARCAGDQDAYWPYHDRLFAQQPQWSGQSDPYSSFVDYAAELGLDRGSFRDCLGSDRHAELVSANMLLGQRLGVTGTPNLFLDTGDGRGQRVEDWSPGVLRPMLDSILAEMGYGDEEGDGPGDGA